MRLIYSEWHDEFANRKITVTEIISAASTISQSSNEEKREEMQLL